MTRIPLLSAILVFSFISCNRQDTRSSASAPGKRATNNSIARTKGDNTGDFTYSPRTTGPFVPSFDPSQNDEACVLMQSLKQRPQLISINNNADTIITGEQGTRILVPANAFQLEDGTEVSGDVRVQLKECYSYSDMLAEGLSTHTDTSTLQSAGMINVEVYKGNEPLQLREGKELGIRFNNNETSDNYKLYYGKSTQDGDINWNLDSLGDRPAPIIISKSGRFARVSDDFFAGNYCLDKETMMNLLDKEWTCSASFDVHGDINGRTYFSESDVQVKRAMDKFTDIISSLKHFVAPTLFPQNRVEFNFSCLSRQKYLEMLARTEVESESFKFILENISTRQGFFARALGWFNCDASPVFKVISTPLVNALSWADKRQEENKKKRMLVRHLAVQLNAAGYEVGSVRIAFTDMKTVIPGVVKDDRCSFDGIPEGKEVCVIATLYKNGKIFMAMQKVKVSEDDAFVSLRYKPYTDAQSVRDAFSGLDKL